jgi:AcrR family transcriptional regulator
MKKKRENSAVRQKQIIDAARKLVVKHGSEHVTVRRIAQEVGVTEGAIYRHFKSKRDILSLLIQDIDDTLMSDIRKNYKGELKTIETLGDIILSHLSSIEQRKGVSFQVIAEIISLGDKRLNKQMKNAINNYLDSIKDILSQGVKKGLVRDDIDLDAVATSFLGITQGLVNIWALGNYDFSLQEKYKPVWNFFREAVIKH